MVGKEVLQQVLERAFSDPQFRARLEAGLEEALEGEGYALGQEDLQQLKAVLDEGKDTFATGLDQRLSQSGVSLSPQALLRAKSKAASHTESLEDKGFRSSGHAAQKKARQPIRADSLAGQPDITEKNDSYDDGEPDYEIETD